MRRVVCSQILAKLHRSAHQPLHVVLPQLSSPQRVLGHRYAHAQRQLTLSPTQRQTIYALATAPGKAGVAVIRVSGPAVKEVYSHMIQKDPSRLKARSMQRCAIVDPQTKELLDDGMYVYFAGMGPLQRYPAATLTFLSQGPSHIRPRTFSSCIFMADEPSYLPYWWLWPGSLDVVLLKQGSSPDAL